MATRKSTPKYQVVTVHGGTLIYGPASKTDCSIAMRGMNRKGKPPVVRIESVTRSNHN